VLLSGICNTDLELVRGYHGFSGVPGHEFVGRVEGPAASRWLGKRVVGEINLGCGACDFCGKDLARHCRRRRVLGILGHPGAHAEFLTLPEANLREVPRELSDEEAVFVEPLAAACEILEQIPVPGDTRAAVVGVGKLGSLVAQVLEDVGARVTRIGSGDTAKAASYDLVIEATGSPEGMPRAIELVRPRGTIVWKSTHHGPASFDGAPVVINEITIVGSRCGRFEPALERLREKRVDVTSLVSGEFPLYEAKRALAAAARPGARKILLRPEGGR